MNSDQQQQVPGYLLTILRIYLGVILLYTVIGKLTASSPFVDEMLGFINFEIKAGRPAGFYTSFLQLHRWHGRWVIVNVLWELEK